MNSPSTLTVKEVPHLRIIDDDLRAAAKARQAATKRAQRTGIDKARRPKFLFSKADEVRRLRWRVHDRVEGWNSGATTTAPLVHRSARNSRVIKRTDVEAAGLSWRSRNGFLTPERLEAFSREFVAESNRLRAEHQSKLASARREFEGIDRRQMQILGY